MKNLIKTPTVAALAVSASLLALAAPAAAQSTTSFLDVGASLGYSSNPFLRDGNDEGSATGRIFVQGSHSVITERTQWSLSAYAENTAYLTDHASSQLANVSAAVRHRASERVHVFGDVRFSVDAGGQLLSRFTDSTIGFPGAPAPTPTVPGPGAPAVTPAAVTPLQDADLQQLPIDPYDPAIFGLRRRQYAVSGQLGASFQASARDSLGLSAGAQHVFFGGNSDTSNYTSFNATGTWDRQLSERTTIGAGLQVRRTQYSDSGHRSTILNPFVRVSTSLSEGWSASSSVGASFLDQDLDGDSDHSVGISLDGSICKLGEASRFCANAGRSVQPSSLGSAFTTTSVGLNYSQRLSRVDTLDLSASAYRYRGEDELAEASDSTFAALDARYSRELTPRLFAGVSGGVRSLDRRDAKAETDLNGSVFVRYRFGDVR